MRVAVIIVNYNDAENTVKYVNKISEYENIQKIVVVDNQSTEKESWEKLQKIKGEKVEVIQSDKNGGYSYGNNFGVKYLDGLGEKYDYIIISNSDIDIEKTAIDRCLEVLENDGKIAVAAPRMYNFEGKPIRRSSWKSRTFLLDVIHSTRILEILFYKKLRSGEYLEIDYNQGVLEVEAISGAFFVTKYDVFKEVGGFDENIFLFYEEDILAKKMQEKGYKTVSINDVKFTHFESQTIGKTLSYYKKIQQLYKSKMYYHKKYNNIKWWQEKVFQILNMLRKIELIFEIPIRKFLKK